MDLGSGNGRTKAGGVDGLAEVPPDSGRIPRAVKFFSPRSPELQLLIARALTVDFQ